VDILLPATPSSQTIAVVLMFGWFGSKKQHVRKYANLYTDRKCAVVFGIAPFLSVTFGHTPTFRKLVRESVGEVCKIVRHVEKEKRIHVIKQESDQSLANTAGESLPILIHSFSNGGTFVTTELTSMIQEGKKAEDKENQDKIDLRLFADRIKSGGFEIFDSAPAYLYPEKFHQVIESAAPNKPIMVVSKILVTIASKLIELSDLMSGREPYPTRFWKNMIESDLCKRQVFLYSTTDALTDSLKVEELIQLRKSRGIEVFDLNFKDSEHVQHWRKYPKEYEHMLEEILRRC